MVELAGGMEVFSRHMEDGASQPLIGKLGCVQMGNLLGNLLGLHQTLLTLDGSTNG